MSKEVEQVAELIARECSMYSEHALEKERFYGVANRIIAMLEKAPKSLDCGEFR